MIRSNNIHAISALSDFEWFDLLCKSAENEEVSLPMPGFPPRELQKQWIGSSGSSALMEVFPFFRSVKNYCRVLGKEINENTKLLDFGCGWGRITRFFAKDINPENILGIDVNKDILTYCNDGMVYGNFRNIDPEPPTNIEDESIDVIISYSVFTHLREDVAHKWMSEFQRILKPGGLAIITVRSDRFLDSCDRLRNRQGISDYEQMISQLFVPMDELKEKYSNGEFIHKSNNPNSTYGDTVIPYQYIAKEFSKYLQVVHYLEKYPNLSQEIVVLAKNKEPYHVNFDEMLLKVKPEKLNIGNRKIIGWGCGKTYEDVKNILSCDIDYFIDSNTDLQGTTIDSKEIFSPDKLLDENKDNIYIFVFVVGDYYNIARWLETNGFHEMDNYVRLTLHTLLTD